MASLSLETEQLADKSVELVCEKNSLETEQSADKSVQLVCEKKHIFILHHLFLRRNMPSWGLIALVNVL